MCGLQDDLGLVARGPDVPGVLELGEPLRAETFVAELPLKRST